MRGLIFFLLLTGLISFACRSSSGGQTGNPGRETATAGSASRTTNVRIELGFATKQKFLDHYDKHGKEFGSISKEEYLLQAQVLRDLPAGGDILEAVREDGVITRFNSKTGAFLAFNPDLTIRTYFKPNDGENYFRRQARRRR
jgi:pyocin large subunit-like protein